MSKAKNVNGEFAQVFLTRVDGGDEVGELFFVAECVGELVGFFFVAELFDVDFEQGRAVF